jgi:hypothetical protein
MQPAPVLEQECFPQFFQKIPLAVIIAQALEPGGGGFGDPFQMGDAARRQGGTELAEDGGQVVLKRGPGQEVELPPAEIQGHQFTQGEGDRRDFLEPGDETEQYPAVGFAVGNQRVAGIPDRLQIAKDGAAGHLAFLGQFVHARTVAGFEQADDIVQPRGLAVFLRRRGGRSRRSLRRARSSGRR